MEVASILFILFLIGVVPAASVLWTTVARIYGYRKKGNAFRIQYHISDILAATFCLGITAAIAQATFHFGGGESTVVAYFVAAACVGVVAGKVWHLTSVTNTWGFGAAYIALGTFFWTLAAVGPLLIYGLLNFRCC